VLNNGATGIEIAQDIELPPRLESAWHARGYYGSVSHNVKAIYQRYMGWFDGHPSSLWQPPSPGRCHRYVDGIGGVKAVIDKAQECTDYGDLRLAAELLKHAVFADPDNPSHSPRVSFSKCSLAATDLTGIKHSGDPGALTG
jgi:alkyl sulfatase BDS1-like metallo-beta-lactamase superfamily hydrolase